MELKTLLPQVEEWRQLKLNNSIFEANKLELKIIEETKDKLMFELDKYSTTEIQDSINNLQDIFTIYNEIKTQGNELSYKKATIVSRLKKLKMKDKQWGLSEEENNELNALDNELRFVDMKLSLYNHLVNFNVPDTIEKYCTTGDVVSLVEICRFIDDRELDNYMKERMSSNE